MKKEKQINRRRFLYRLLSFVLGGGSAAAGILAVFKGSRIDPFLCLDSTSVLKRFGTGTVLLDELKISHSQQRRYARKIVRLKLQFDKNPSLYKTRNFTHILRYAMTEDYKSGKVFLVKNWLLSETEIAIFIYNNIRKYRLVQ